MSLNFDHGQQLTGLVDPACPINWSHPLNRWLVADYSIPPNAGMRGGNYLRPITQFGPKNPARGVLTNGAVFNGAARLPGGYGTIFYDGTDSYVNCGTPVIGGASSLNFSFSIWANTNTTANSSGGGGLRYILSTEASSNGWMLRYSPSGSSDQFQLYCYTTSGGLIGPVTYSGIVANRWYHLIGTFNFAGNLVLYVNGVSVGSTTLIGGLNVASGGDLYIGNSSFNSNLRAWGGWIDGPQMFSVSLTASQALSLYQETKQGNPNRLNWITRGTFFQATSPPPPPAAGVVIGSPIVGSRLVVGSNVVGGLSR